MTKWPILLIRFSVVPLSYRVDILILTRLSSFRTFKDVDWGVKFKSEQKKFSSEKSPFYVFPSNKNHMCSLQAEVTEVTSQVIWHPNLSKPRYVLLEAPVLGTVSVLGRVHGKEHRRGTAPSSSITPLGLARDFLSTLLPVWLANEDEQEDIQ